MLKYFFSEINYGGRVHRAEDAVTLRAIIDDLVHAGLALCPETKPNLDQSHHGIPPLSGGDTKGEGSELSYYGWLDAALPDRDASRIYGFNEALEHHLLSTEIKSTLGQLYDLNISEQNSGSGVVVDITSSIEMQSLQTSLGSKNAAVRQDLLQLLEDPNSLLALFSAL